MKKWITSLLAITLISGCATIPSTPKPHETKYAIQVLEVKTKSPFDQKLMNDPNEIEEILNNPNTTIYEYPTLYAQVGETVADDQTKTVSMPEDYDVINGKAVVCKEKEIKLGKAVEVSISSVKKDAITYKIDVHNQKLVGYDKIKSAEGVEFKVPYFDVLKVNTEITQTLSEWMSLVGLKDTKGDSVIFCFRTLPPKQTK